MLRSLFLLYLIKEESVKYSKVQGWPSDSKFRNKIQKEINPSPFLKGLSEVWVCVKAVLRTGIS